MSDFWITMAIGVIIGFLLGVAVFVRPHAPDYRKEAVQHACAHYDTQTGAWQWNTPAQGGTP